MSSDRETRLNSLGMKLGRRLEEDFQKEGSGLWEMFIRDFEREILLAESFASRQDPTETVCHRALADMLHRILKDLELIAKND